MIYFMWSLRLHLEWINRFESKTISMEIFIALLELAEWRCDCMYALYDNFGKHAIQFTAGCSFTFGQQFINFNLYELLFSNNEHY